MLGGLNEGSTSPATLSSAWLASLMALFRSSLRSLSLKILLTKPSTSLTAPLATPSRVPMISRLGRLGMSGGLNEGSTSPAMLPIA